MTTHNLGLGFEIGQKVWLCKPSLEALVQSILFNDAGVQFQVSYWDHNVRRVEWVFASEIVALATTVKH